MPKVRIRERNQLTLPMAIATAANLQVNDTLDVTFVNGVISLLPVASESKRRSIRDFAGMAKGVWGKTPKEVETYFRTERRSWER